MSWPRHVTRVAPRWSSTAGEVEATVATEAEVEADDEDEEDECARAA
jgi:hypothetical protein